MSDAPRSRRDLWWIVLALAASALAALTLFGWALPERALLAPLLEVTGTAFGAPLRVLFAGELHVAVLAAASFLALVGTALARFTARRSLARAALVAATLSGLGFTASLVLGVREARALVLPAGASACPCPEALASVEPTVCACQGASVVAQIGVEGPTTRFAYDAEGLVTRFELRAGGLEGARVRTCTLDPPKPLGEIASAVLRCTQ